MPRHANNPVSMSDLPRRRRAEEGSAYLVVLMLLVVLTIIGLSLSVITQTEVLIGGSEKQSTRQLFSAGSGVQLAAVYELVANDSAKHRLKLASRAENLFGQTTSIQDEVCTSAFIPLAVSTCNLCMMNQDASYVAAQYGVTSRASRHDGEDLASTHEVGGMIALEPWERSFMGYQVSSDEALKDDDAPVGSTGSPDTNLCDDLFLKV